MDTHHTFTFSCTFSCFWQKIGDYEVEVVVDVDYDTGTYVPNSMRYSGRYRAASY
ncbi:MAG: hypothetical protein WC654_06240 [Patescibacteria group bacterium]